MGRGGGECDSQIWQSTSGSLSLAFFAFFAACSSFFAAGGAARFVESQAPTVVEICSGRPVVSAARRGSYAAARGSCGGQRGGGWQVLR